MKKYLVLAVIFTMLLSSCEGEQAVTEPTSAPTLTVTSAPTLSPTLEPTPKPTVKAEKQASETKKPDKASPKPDSEKGGESSKKGGLSGKFIYIDPGHGKTDKKGTEKIAPDSETTKAKYVSGADGSRYSEEEINLMVAQLVKQKLESKGAKVRMTREGHSCDYSNIERAKLANEAGADLMIRIHADSSDSSSARGMSMLIPSNEHISDSDMVKTSRRIGEAVLEGAVAATGAKNRGCVERPDMTGFNWSEVPVILIEMGFLSNAEEDEKLSTESYREKIAEGIVDGLSDYYGG